MRDGGVVGLPARTLGIADPDVAGVAEQVLGDLGLEADLELDFQIVQFGQREGKRVVRIGRVRVGVDLAGPERRQHVHRLVGTQLERAQLGIGGQFPAAVEQGAATGIGDGGAVFRVERQVIAAEQLVPALARALGQAGVGGQGGGTLLFQHRLCLDGGLVGLFGGRRDVAAGLVVAGQARGIRGQGQAGFQGRRTGGAFLGPQRRAQAAGEHAQDRHQGRSRLHCLLRERTDCITTTTPA